MSEHPIVACFNGLDSATAVGLGALLAGALDEPLVLASAYRYEPVGLSARAVPVPDNSRRAAAAQAALHRAREFVPTDIDVREQIVPSTRVADASSRSPATSTPASSYSSSSSSSVVISRDMSRAHSYRTRRAPSRSRR